ncbi:MAG TPA: hypothetical protein VIV57_27550 [Anaeromyxobacter sp.]
MKLVEQAIVAAILSASGAASAAAPACDGGRAVEVVRAEASRQRLDVSTLQLVMEGPYARAKFIRTHPAFRPSPAVKQRLAKRTFYFVWFHPPFRDSVGARGTDLWALVGSGRCDLLHLERGR